jgi:uncharacterized repeat protein (TIGR01451 family)
MKKIYCLFIFIFITAQLHSQSLVSISPNSSQPGQTINALITGASTTFQSSSPQGNLDQIYLQLGGNVIYSDFQSIFVTDDTHFNVDFPIPSSGSPIGVYDLYVNYFDQFFNYITLTLPQSFTVGTPDGYITGQVFQDLNNNGIKEAAEPGVANMTVKLLPTNYTLNTDANGNYSFAVANGSYNVSWINNTNNYKFLTSAASYNVTINNNNSSGNNFGIKSGLLSATPNVALQGQLLQISVASDSIFRTNANPNGNISNAYIKKVGGTTAYYSTLSTQVQVQNWADASIYITIPASAQVGLYDLYINTSSPYSGTHILPACIAISPAQSFVSGKTYFDSNSNGIYDAGDINLQGVKVTLQPDNVLGIADANGNFQIGCTNGSKTLTYVSDPAFLLNSSPATYSFSVNNATASNKDFGFTTGVPTYNSTLSAAGLARCNTTQPFTFTFNNQSNIPVSGVMYIVASSNVTYSSANPAPDFTSGDTLFWNFSNVNLFASVQKTIYYTLPGAGSVVNFTTFVNITNAGNVVYSNLHVSNTTVLCSFDPNDKAVDPPGVLDENYTLKNELLTYKIRFQNTGNDTAFTVQVRDLLDPELNWNTFQLVTSSHPCSAELNMITGALQFTFNNILLPDSNVNEPGSNGYVIYSIEADSGLLDGTRITNTANIYFDANDPVVTNTTLNTLVDVIPVGLNDLAPEKSSAIVIPNPASEKALLRFDNIAGNAYKLNIYSTSGKLMYADKTSTGEVILKLNKFSTGMYVYELMPFGNGKTYRGKFVVR